MDASVASVLANQWHDIVCTISNIDAWQYSRQGIGGAHEPRHSTFRTGPGCELAPCHCRKQLRHGICHCPTPPKALQQHALRSHPKQPLWWQLINVYPLNNTHAHL